MLEWQTMSLLKIKTFGMDILKFIKDVANDAAIPDHDKKILLALLALIASPIDLIPDWIPVFGQLDDLVMFALILDYFFEVLDQSVLLRHYPFDMKSFIRIKKTASFFSFFVPTFIKDRLWSYVGSPYRK